MLLTIPPMHAFLVCTPSKIRVTVDYPPSAIPLITREVATNLGGSDPDKADNLQLFHKSKAEQEWSEDKAGGTLFQMPSAVSPVTPAASLAFATAMSAAFLASR